MLKNLPLKLGEGNPTTIKVIAEIRMRKELLNELKNLHRLQESDDALGEMFNNGSRNLDICKHAGVMYAKLKTEQDWKFLIPRTFIQRLLLETHTELSHAGSGKLYKYKIQ